MLSVNHSGLLDGYEALFNLTSDEVWSHHPYTGINIILHHQSQPPQMSNGFVVSPGASTYIRMSKIEVRSGRRTLKSSLFGNPISQIHSSKCVRVLKGWQYSVNSSA